MWNVQISTNLKEIGRWCRRMSELTIEELKEHCLKVIEPSNKIVLDENSKTYQEHKLILDLIKEHENQQMECCDCIAQIVAFNEERIREEERRKFAEWLQENVCITDGITIVKNIEYTRVITFVELLSMYEEMEGGVEDGPNR